PQPFDQALDVTSKRCNIIALRWLIGLVVAAQVGGDDGIAMLCKEGYLETPGIPELGEAVQEEDEWAAALGYVVHANAVGDDMAVLPCFCCLHYVFLSRATFMVVAPLSVKIRNASWGMVCIPRALLFPPFYAPPAAAHKG